MSSTKRMRRDLRNALFGVATQWNCGVCGKYRDGAMTLCGTCEQAANLAERLAHNTLKTRRLRIGAALMSYDADEQERVLEFLGGLPCATEKGIEFEFEDVIGTNGTVFQELVMRKRGGVPMVKSANKC